MKTLAIYGATALLLTGCGLVLGGLEDRTDETKAEVKKTNESVSDTNKKISQLLERMATTNELLTESNFNMTEMERVQMLGAATAIVANRQNPLPIRGRMAQVMFLTGEMTEKDDQLYESLGAIAPLNFEAVDLPDLGGTRNVTIVADAVVAGRTVVFPADKELYDLYAGAARKMLSKLVAGVQDPNKNRDTLRRWAEKAMYVVPTVLGAAKSLDDARVVTEAAAREKFVQGKDVRDDAATTLRRLHGALSMEDLVPAATMEAQIETKMFGIKRADP